MRPLAPGLLAVVALSCVEGEPPPGDIVLVTVDTLRADHVGLYGYARETTPELDRWFAGGAVFERAYAAEAATSPSVASLLSGLLPQEHGVRLFYQLLPEDVLLVSDRLRPRYQTAAFVSNMVLTDEAMGLARHFDHFDDRVDQRESGRRVFERNAEATTDAALLWLVRERDPQRPLFLWVHYIDPHGPYRPPEAWRNAFEHEGHMPLEPDRIPPYGRLDGVDDALTYVDRYDAEIRYADHHIGRLLDGYARLADAERALIVFTADHGETMARRERWFDHGYQVWEDIVRVPLLLRGPEVESGRYAGLASGVDVAVTLLAQAGLSAAGTHGLDLRRGSRVPRERTVFCEASRKGRQWRAAIQGDLKWVVAVVGEERQIPIRGVYDLASDPGEDRFLDWRDGEPAAALLRLVAEDPDPAGLPTAYAAGVRLKAPKVAPGVSDEALEALRALGYAE